jgi:hypothetical protein
VAAVMPLALARSRAPPLLTLVHDVKQRLHALGSARDRQRAEDHYDHCRAIGAAALGLTSQEGPRGARLVVCCYPIGAHAVDDVWGDIVEPRGTSGRERPGVRLRAARERAATYWSSQFSCGHTLTACARGVSSNSDQPLRTTKSSHAPAAVEVTRAVRTNAVKNTPLMMPAS